MRLLLTLVLLAGCDRVFELERLEDAAPATPDAELVGERPSFCASAALFDTFDASTPCGFGAPFEQTSLAQHDGVLEITLDGTRAYFAGCTAFQPLPFTNNGVFVHVPQHLTTVFAYTALVVRETYQTTPALNASILFAENKLYFKVNGISYMQRDDVPAWWRLRVPTGTTDITGELSNDGITWEPFGSHAAALPVSISIDIGAGITTTPSTSGSAKFSALGVCN